jgi:hypothetical protein
MPRQPLSLCCQVAERPQLYRRRERTVVPLTVKPVAVALSLRPATHGSFLNLKPQ